MQVKRLLAYLMLLSCIGCEGESWNNPYPNDPSNSNTLYTAFTQRPKHLDPARSYSSGEWALIAQIYEPPLQYHYRKRPYQLEPLVAAHMPVVRYLDQAGSVLPASADPKRIAYSEYTIRLKSNIAFQPHPCFAKTKAGAFRYHNLSPAHIKTFNRLAQFKQVDTRILKAEDFVFQIKRLAHPALNSPIYGFLSHYIVGLSALRQRIKQSNLAEVDLKQIDFKGAQVIDRNTYRITLKGKYPQFLYWLAMPFFAPMPWEAIAFYNQPGMGEENIVLDWYPVGTGPYLLRENNPERRMVLEKNPNFRKTFFENREIPFLDRVVFSLEKEDLPYWNKFLQGYYDQAGIPADQFNQAIDFAPDGGLGLSTTLLKKGIRLETADLPSIFYWGFNFLDPVLGGKTLQARYLRTAIAMAFDVEEFIAIFNNNRATIAQSPIPPGILGYEAGVRGMNKHLYRYDALQKKPIKKTLAQAKALLAKAGYLGGINTQTGEPLILYFDTMSSGDPNEKANYAWIRKQFEKLGIQLIVRATDYNRFQDKMRNGTAQIFFWGWNLDYPDPENILFMFYSQNAKVPFGGENAANFSDPTYDRLFEQMRVMDNTPEKAALIQKMLAILQLESPWIFGYHPKSFALYQPWYAPVQPNPMARNTLKYVRLDPKQRAQLRRDWNPVLWWPMFAIGFCGLVVLFPIGVAYYRKFYRVQPRVKLK